MENSDYIIPEPQVTAPQPSAAPEVPVTPDAPVVEAQPQFDLSALTGGRIVDPASLTGVLSEYDALKSRMADFEAQQQNVNPLQSKIAELFQSGKPIAEIQSFLEIQAIDPKAMTPLEAIRYAERHKNPFLDTAELDAHIAETLNLKNAIEGEQLDASESARLKMAYHRSAEYLQGLKVSEQAQVAPQAVAQQAFDVSPIVNSIDVKALTFEEGDYKFSFPVPQEVVAQAKQIAINTLNQAKINDTAQAQQMVNNLLQVQLGNDFMKAMALDMRAKAQIEAAKSNAGAMPQTPTLAPAVPGRSNAPMNADALLY